MLQNLQVRGPLRKVDYMTQKLGTTIPDLASANRARVFTLARLLTSVIENAGTLMLSQKLTLEAVPNTVNSKLCMGFGDCHVSYIETDFREGHFSVYIPETSKLSGMERKARREEAILQFKFAALEALQGDNLSIAQFIREHMNNFGEGIFNQPLKLSEDGKTVTIGYREIYISYTHDDSTPDGKGGNFKLFANRKLVPGNTMDHGFIESTKFGLVSAVMDMRGKDERFRQFVSQNSWVFYVD